MPLDKSIENKSHMVYKVFEKGSKFWDTPHILRGYDINLKVYRNGLEALADDYYYDYYFGGIIIKNEGIYTFTMDESLGCNFSTDTLNLKFKSTNLKLESESKDTEVEVKNFRCPDEYLSCSLYINGVKVEGSSKSKVSSVFKNQRSYMGKDSCLKNENFDVLADKFIESPQKLDVAYDYGVKLNDSRVVNICKGDKIAFFGSINDERIGINNIYKDGVLYANATGVFSNYLSEPGTYYFTKRCANRSDDFIIKEVDIQNKLSTEILNQELCKGSTTSVSLNTNAEEINWYNQQNELVGIGKTLEINKANNYYAISRIGECYKTSDWVFYKENEKPTASLIANSQDINIGKKATFQLKFSGNPPFEFVINDTLKLNATNNDYTYSFVPIYNGEYKVTSVKNTCGLGTATGKAQIQVLLANEKSDFSDKISIFPNPSFEFVSIQSQLLKPNDVKIELYNSQGKLIKEEKTLKAKEINTMIEMQKLPSGIYNVRIQVGDSVYSRKIVKN